MQWRHIPYVSRTFSARPKPPIPPMPHNPFDCFRRNWHHILLHGQQPHLACAWGWDPVQEPRHGSWGLERGGAASVWHKCRAGVHKAFPLHAHTLLEWWWRDQVHQGLLCKVWHYSIIVLRISLFFYSVFLSLTFLLSFSLFFFSYYLFFMIYYFKCLQYLEIGTLQMCSHL